MGKFFFAAGIVLLAPLNGDAQVDQAAWRGKKAAVVISYDDGYDQQLDNAVPVLDSLGLKATFYISAFYPAVKNRIAEWKKLADKGNELGNHTLYHPCIGGPGREWVRPDYDLRNYTVSRMVDEVRMENVYLQSVDGRSKRTFAFTCADTKAGGVDFSNDIKNDFVALRSVRNEMHRINEVDLNNVDCYMVNKHSAEQMIGWVNKAIETNSLLVILFHGVGGGNRLNVSLSDHRKFLQYLKQNEKDILVAPMVEIAEYIKSRQK